MKRSYAYEDGKDFFEPGADVRDFYHYVGDNKDVLSKDFVDGWNHARGIYEMKHGEENKFMMFSDNCPWHDRSRAPSTKCKATSEECSKENCALIYLKENYDGI